MHTPGDSSEYPEDASGVPRQKAPGCAVSISGVPRQDAAGCPAKTQHLLNFAREPNEAAEILISQAGRDSSNASLQCLKHSKERHIFCTFLCARHS